MRKKAVIYVRVSSKEQAEQGYSPDAQKRLLWAFARSNGFDVAEEFEDAETAKKAGRTAFNAMLEYVCRQGIKHILVEKTDRLTRNFKDYGFIEDLMRDNDVTVHLVKEAQSIDKNSSSNQKFLFGIKTLMAKNFLDNLSEETRKGQNEKIVRGEYPGRPPLGYLNAEDPLTKHNVIVVDESNVPLIREMFRRYATGNHSLLSLIKELEGVGLTQNLPPGRRLNKTTVAKLLASVFYIGNFPWDGKVHKGSHPALVDLETWQRVQDILFGRANNRANKKYNQIPFAFKGMFACGECGRAVTAELKKRKYVYYRCTKYERVCHQRPVKEEAILAEMRKVVAALGISDLGIRYIVAGLKKSLEEKRAWHDTEYRAMAHEHQVLKNRLDRMYEDRLDGKVSDALYDEKSKEYTERLEVLGRKIAQHDRADVDYYEFGIKILELAQKAEYLYNEATPEERRELLRFLLSNSTLKDGKADFSLKQPFSIIAKRPPEGERLAWGARGESNPRDRLHRAAFYH